MAAAGGGIYDFFDELIFTFLTIAAAELPAEN
jgi:hypothetical protein